MEQSNFHLLFLFCFLCFHSDVFESRVRELIVSLFIKQSFR